MSTLGGYHDSCGELISFFFQVNVKISQPKRNDSRRIHQISLSFLVT